MMRRIGFGLRFSALVIDALVIIILVFGLDVAFGKHLYSTIGVMKAKAEFNPDAQIGIIINGAAVGAEAAAPSSTPSPASANTTRVNSRGNDINPQTQNRDNDVPMVPREQRTRYALPSQNQPEVNEQQTPVTPPVVVSESNRIEQEALKKPRGYIHNSKDFVKIFFFSIIAILYFLIEGLKGITPGKLLLRLKIFTNERETPSKKNLLLRYVYKIAGPSLIIFVYSLTKVNFFWTFGMILFFTITVGCFFVFSNSMQTLYDRLTGTAVFSLYLNEETEENADPLHQS